MENAATKPGATASQADTGFRAVNPHCLARIVELSETHQVVASDDIHDDRGNKLWAKGSPVSRDLRDKLLRRSLAQPLESSLSVERGATMESIVVDALAHIDENAVLSAVAGSNRARGLLRDMQKLVLPGPVKLLLTSARENKQATYSHGLATMIICAGLASRLELSDHDANMLTLAALVHDIGEMYINPEYLDTSKHLSPANWKYVASHPCVGHAFIGEFTSFPSVVAACVLHHHERLDGSGYPFQLGGKAIERLSAILAVADSVSAIAMRGGSGLRIRLEVALRIVPEEFDRSAASVINHALQGLPAETYDAGRGGCLGRIVPILHQLTSTTVAAEALVAATSSSVVNATGRYVLSVLGNIEKSLRATGVFETIHLAAIESDANIMGEICLIVREISWRLRNMARNVHLRIEQTGNPEEMKSVGGLIALLDPAAQAAD